MLAAVLGYNVAAISTIMIAGLLLWICVNSRSVVQLLHNQFFHIALLLIFIWPLMTVVYAPELSIKRISLQSYYFLLFTSTVIFLKKYSINKLSGVVAVSYWTSIVGLFWSFFYPEHFSSIADIVSAKTDYYGRAFGFMMQPNMAVTNLTILFIFYLAFGSFKKRIILYSVIISFVLAILLTGSRTGIVIMLIIGLTNILYLNRHYFNLSNGRILVRRILFTKLLFFTVAMLLISILSVTTMQYIIEKDIIKTEQSGFGLRERFNSFLSGKLSDVEVGSDDNIQARLNFQKAFIEKIVDRPLIGYGLGSRDVMMTSGELLRPSHNQYLNYTLEYGMIYCLLFFSFFFIMPLFLKKRRLIEAYYRNNWIVQTSVAILLLSLVSNTVLFIRNPWALMGTVFYFLYCTNLQNRQ